MQLNNINHLMAWQHQLTQAQMLAAKMPCTGLSPDKLASLPLDDLLGALAYLKGRKAEREA